MLQEKKLLGVCVCFYYECVCDTFLVQCVCDTFLVQSRYVGSVLA